MHGRLKVKSTAEQQEAKRKEREKKLQIYNAATSQIFKKKKNGELDEELLAITGEVLAVNPDFYTLWNYRKEAFLELKKAKEAEELQKMFTSELYFLESCLKINPKSYGTWHHRCFVMETMPEPDWARELELCNTFLKYDERNFHCWDYRRFVVKKSNVPPEAEFEYSMTKISNNFSNYSSWHYRSKLLPILFPDSSQPMGVSEEALLKEYELVQNGIFTDPDDQSNWFYHRWLMGRGEQTQSINSLSVFREEDRVMVSFVKHIQISADTVIRLEFNGTAQNVSWKNHLGDAESFSTLWIASDATIPTDSQCDIKVTLQENDQEICSECLQLSGTENNKTVCSDKNGSGQSRFSQELSAVKNERLQEELESISQLMELESDNKWAVLSVVLLMKALDPVKYNEDILQNIDKLIALDFKRANYYKDLRSKFMIENFLDGEDLSLPSPSLSFCGRGLTKLYHTELMPLLTSLDLSDNQLREVNHYSYLQRVVTVDLGDNQIESGHGLENMDQLTSLNLKNNKLHSPADLLPLQSCPRLRTLNISGNPVCVSELHKTRIEEMFPEVEIVFKASSS